MRLPRALSLTNLKILVNPWVNLAGEVSALRDSLSLYIYIHIYIVIYIYLYCFYRVYCARKMGGMEVYLFDIVAA